MARNTHPDDNKQELYPKPRAYALWGSFMSRGNWHAREIEDALMELDTPLGGLSSQDASTRLEEYGPNRLSEPPKASAFLRFLAQFHDPLNYLLIGAALVALAIHPNEPGDAIFIFLVLTANAFFGYWQENQAEQAMGALKQMAVSQCVVCRDGLEMEIPTIELVPGDIVKLEEGLKVPADIRVTESWQCKVDESALTGESMPTKVTCEALSVETLLADMSNMLFMGTTISTGRSVGIVTSTGMGTELGELQAILLAQKHQKRRSNIN